MLTDDALEHVDEDRSAASKAAPTFDQARFAATAVTAADADEDVATDALDAADAADAAPLSAGAPHSPTKLNEALALAIFQASWKGFVGEVTLPTEESRWTPWQG